METLGFLVVTRFPSVIVPECIVKGMSGVSVLKCVQNTSVMACVSACVEMDGPIQTGDGCGEPFVPYRVILVTAPVPRDAAYEACSAFRERPSRAHLRGRIPVQERPAFRKRPSRGRLKWRRRLVEFGTRGFPRGCVCEAPHAACHVFCSRSEFPGRCARANLHGKPRRFGARVTSAGISRQECRVNSACCPTWGIPRKRALFAMRRAKTRTQVSSDGRDERACRKPPPWRCKKKRKKPRSKYTARQRCGKHPVWA